MAKKGSYKCRYCGREISGYQYWRRHEHNCPMMHNGPADTPPPTVGAVLESVNQLNDFFSNVGVATRELRRLQEVDKQNEILRAENKTLRGRITEWSVIINDLNTALARRE